MPLDRIKERPLDVVTEQAEDEGLWFIAQTAPEAHLQDALRRLTAAVEGTPWPRHTTGNGEE